MGKKNKTKTHTFCFLRRHSLHDVVVLSARDGRARPCCTASDMVRGPARRRGEGRWRRASTVIDTGVGLCVCGVWAGRPGLAKSTSSGRRADTYNEHRQGVRRCVCEASGMGPLGTSAPGRGLGRLGSGDTPAGGGGPEGQRLREVCIWRGGEGSGDVGS